MKILLCLENILFHAKAHVGTRTGGQGVGVVVVGGVTLAFKGCWLVLVGLWVVGVGWVVSRGLVARGWVGCWVWRWVGGWVGVVGVHGLGVL